MKRSVAIALGCLLTGGTVWGQYLITTVAGGGLPATASPALSAPLAEPFGAAVDGPGNIYFAAANSVFKVDTAGVLTRVAGSIVAGSAGDGGPAADAELDSAQGVALDSAGNLYIADSGNCRIRKVAVDGSITTVAGNGTPGYSGNGGPGTSAQLRFPHGVAVDGAGNLYIADTYNSRIRKVAAATGIISTVAGTAFVGLFGDGGLATDAELNHPYGVAVDTAGNFYIADTANNAIRKVTVANGIINTVAGISTGAAGYTGDGAAATSAELNGPFGVALDGAGNLYIADSGNSRVREVTVANGIINTVAGNGTYGYSGDGGAATSAKISAPYGVALDTNGNLYIADSNNSVIRKVASGVIATVAGNGIGYAGDGGPATGALIKYAYGAAVDASGDLYIADAANNRIRKVATNGTITTVAGTGTAGYSGDGGPATSAELNGPAGVLVDGAGNLYISDTGNSRVREVVANGTIATVAGNGTAAFSGDKGPATSASLSFPYGLAMDTAGNLYIADTYNSVIRKVATNGTITTVAGDNVPGYSGDGGSPTAAQLDFPYGLAVDGSGNLYIADSSNNRIREVSSGTIATVAGSNTAGYAGDGAAATSAELQNPQGVAVDAAGDIFIADTGNIVIREVIGSNISTVAGNRGFGAAGDGGPATSAQFNSPYDVVVDSAGDVYVTDQAVVRLLVPQGTHALLSVAETLPGSFAQGQTGGTYAVTVNNAPNAGPTSGTVTVSGTFSTGWTLVSMSGTGWSCSGATCTRGDALSAGSSYPPITVTVNVAADAPSQVSNQAGVSGGGSAAASASGVTTVLGGPLTAPVLVSPANGATGTLLAPTLTWNASSGATSYEVYLGTSSTPPLVTTTAETSYTPATLSLDTTYYWQIVAQNGSGSESSATWSFTTGTALAPLLFVPVTPCRVADTRNAAGPFGGPTMTAGSTRSFAIPQSACAIPSTAQAYSLNVTVVPDGALAYLTLWPAGQPQPLVSTLNSPGGIVVANAAIVPAGSGGAVSVFVANQTDVVLDINGYFDSTIGATSSSFYTATPCRVADTRNPTGQFGGPSMSADQSRAFPVPLSTCQIPSTASAYSLNVTVVPDTDFLGYLTAWPTGQSQPFVSTLNSWTGAVVANAATVPAGTNESISVYVTDPTDVVLDIDGYFGQPGGLGALSFYPLAPCRVVDTRNAAGPFGGPGLAGGATRSFAIPASACSVPATAAAYSLNVTVVPDGVLYYLSTWPTGSPQPLVSTLNSFDGAILANAAIVPAGTSGAISVYVTNPTNVILDINGYFAP
jgi:sugar lactone lactonase YvrE